MVATIYEPVTTIPQAIEKMVGATGIEPVTPAVTGAVCPPLPGGERKGRADWDARDASTESTVVLTREEVAEVRRELLGPPAP